MDWQKYPKNKNRNRGGILHYNSLASMNVKSPLSSSEYMSKPCFCISSLRLDNLPFKDFVVSTVINIPLVTRHLLASVTYSDQFLPIKDNENTATSRASSANGTLSLLQAVTLSFIATWSKL